MIVEQLRRLDLFAALPAQVLGDLAGECAETTRPPGAVLDKGEVGDPPCVFLIVEGMVEVLSGDDPANLVRVGRIEAGGLVGEFSAIDGRHGSCIVRTISSTTLIEIPPRVFRDLVERHPQVAVHLLRDMIKVIRSMNDRLASLKGAHSEFDRIRGELFRFVT
jgi:CRP/FNR family cyclic AMP-dependent transcriptional regulator